MPSDDGWTTATPSAAASTMSASRTGRPQLSVLDMLVLLWRAKWLVLMVAIPIMALAVIGAFLMEKEYAAHSRIQVTAGTERVFDPIVGGAGQSQVLGQQEITQSEVELLHSSVIADRVIQKLGLETILPKMHEKIAKSTAAQRPVEYEKAVAAFQKKFSAGATPKNPVIHTSFKHTDPVIAADILNTLIETYIEYRGELFAGQDAGFISGQRQAASAELTAADTAIEKFLTSNRIGDFDTEKSSVAGLYANITDEIYKVQAQKIEVQGRLSTTRNQLSLTEPTIDLRRETDHQKQLFDLEMQRAQLLAVYQPGTPQIQAIDRKIAETNQLISMNGQAGARIERGPNEIFQNLEGRRTDLEAESRALELRYEELQRQKRQIENRQLQLTRLEPKYQELLRDRAILEEKVKSLTIREDEESLKRDAARADSQNIQILEPARPPSKGQSKRKLIAAAGAVLGIGNRAFIRPALDVYTFNSANCQQRRQDQRTTGSGQHPACKVTIMRDLRTDIAQLADSLVRIPPNGGGRQILVIGARAGEGASSVAASLALLLSGRANRAAWLIDLDLAENTQYHAFEAQSFNQVGRPGRPYDGSLNVRPFYHIVPELRARDGQVPKRPKYLGVHQIESTRLYVSRFRNELLRQGQKIQVNSSPDYWQALRRVADWTVVDAPSLDYSRAALGVCRHMDGVVCVIRADDTPVDRVTALRTEIEAHGGHCLGIVVNGVKADARFADRIAL